ncbi:hypothetical protein MXB_4038 [Myxobolus squamalis]|nr:hypothetical protein MXB_4038 [Myxobolus squamalis]
MEKKIRTAIMDLSNINAIDIAGKANNALEKILLMHTQIFHILFQL